MEIEILNWKTYCQRNDIKSPSWFSFPVKYFTNPEYMNAFTGDSLAVLAYLCAQATKSQGRLKLHFAHAEAFSGLSGARFRDGIEHLKQLQLITVHVRDTYASRTDTFATLHNTTLHNTTQQDTTPTEQPAQAQEPDISLLKPKDVEPESTTTYDHDHETVTVPAEERPLPKLALLWNQHASELLSRVKLCSAARRKRAANCLKEHGEEFWIDLIWKVNASDFCLGKTDRGTWKANFDWFIRSGTAERILEGQYDNRGPGSAPSTPSFWARQHEGKET